MRKGTAALTDDPLEALWFGDDDLLGLNPKAARSVAAAAAQAVGLKPFPAVAQHVLELLENPDVAMPELRVAIEQDAALASRLLRVVNSAAYRRGPAARSIDDAVVRLGLQQVKGIVAGITAFGMFPTEHPLADDVRVHCAGVAALVGVIGREWRGARGAGDLFLLGLLHDIGKLASLQVGEFPYGEVEDPQTFQTPDRLPVWERGQAGYDHGALGATVLHGWDFDDRLVKVVAWHHEPGRAYAEGAEVGLSVALLRVADALEYHLRGRRELDAGFVENLARHGDCSYAGLSADVLLAAGPKLVAAREEVLATLIE
jgi:HD-like signal output (HDOD) protein